MCEGEEEYNLHDVCSNLLALVCCYRFKLTQIHFHPQLSSFFRVLCRWDPLPVVHRMLALVSLLVLNRVWALLKYVVHFNRYTNSHSDNSASSTLNSDSLPSSRPSNSLAVSPESSSGGQPLLSSSFISRTVVAAGTALPEELPGFPLGLVWAPEPLLFFRPAGIFQNTKPETVYTIAACFPAKLPRMRKTARTGARGGAAGAGLTLTW